MLLDPPLESSDTPVATVESGGKLPMLSLGALDAWGNRTAPSQNEDWQVCACSVSAKRVSSCVAREKLDVRIRWVWFCFAF